MLGGCSHDFTEYDNSKQNDLEALEGALNTAVEKLEEFQSLYNYDGEDTAQQLVSKTLMKLLPLDCLKLNAFEYSDAGSNSCGDRWGSTTTLLTFLGEHELKERMRKFAKENPGKYCHHKFLQSMGDVGLYFNDEYGNSIYGSLLGRETSLHNITEKDIYSNDEYSKILAAREEEARKKREADEVARKQRIEEQEIATLKKLQEKYDQRKSPP